MNSIIKDMLSPWKTIKNFWAQRERILAQPDIMTTCYEKDFPDWKTPTGFAFQNIGYVFLFFSICGLFYSFDSGFLVDSVFLKIMRVSMVVGVFAASYAFPFALGEKSHKSSDEIITIHKTYVVGTFFWVFFANILLLVVSSYLPITVRSGFDKFFIFLLAVINIFLFLHISENLSPILGSSKSNIFWTIYISNALTNLVTVFLLVFLLIILLPVYDRFTTKNYNFLAFDTIKSSLEKVGQPVNIEILGTDLVMFDIKGDRIKQQFTFKYKFPKSDEKDAVKFIKSNIKDGMCYDELIQFSVTCGIEIINQYYDKDDNLVREFKLNSTECAIKQDRDGCNTVIKHSSLFTSLIPERR